MRRRRRPVFCWPCRAAGATGEVVMDHKAVTEQLQIEHGMLTHISNALRTTLDWHVEGHNTGRKLESLRFITQSFARHLERVLSLEEQEGYLDSVYETQPHLTKEANC